MFLNILFKSMLHQKGHLIDFSEHSLTALLCLFFYFSSSSSKAALVSNFAILTKAAYLNYLVITRYYIQYLSYQDNGGSLANSAKNIFWKISKAVIALS